MLYYERLSDGTIGMSTPFPDVAASLNLALTTGEEIESAYDNRRYLKSEKPEPPPPTLAELKVAKWEDIKTRRNVAEMSGCPYMGGVLDTDPVSVQRISIAALTAQAAIATAQPFALDWTMKDNSVVTMSAEAVAGMPVALAMYSNRLHQTARQLREAIDAAQSAEDLTAVQWTESEA